jgi:hypothetical protein
MLFIEQHTTISIPKLYATKTFDSDKTMLIMKYVEEDYLPYCLNRTDHTPEQSKSIEAQLSTQVD